MAEEVSLPEIPDKLMEYFEEIQSTALDTLRLKLKSSKTLKPWNSKIGGIPYIPDTEEYPCNSKGSPLRLLAQINFSEMPPLPGYPDKGIVGFFIDSEDTLMGLDLDNQTKQDGFRILYFDTIVPDESKLHSDIKMNSNMSEYVSFPVFGNNETSIEFIKEKQYMSDYDYRFDKISFSSNQEVRNEYNNLISSSGHRIGGYPYFTQEDPRGCKEDLERYDILLLQLDSEYQEGEMGVNIMWGDMGVGAFFINSEDLKKCDFKNVLYNWDCC